MSHGVVKANQAAAAFAIVTAQQLAGIWSQWHLRSNDSFWYKCILTLFRLLSTFAGAVLVAFIFVGPDQATFSCWIASEGLSLACSSFLSMTEVVYPSMVFLFATTRTRVTAAIFWIGCAIQAFLFSFGLSQLARLDSSVGNPILWGIPVTVHTSMAYTGLLTATITQRSMNGSATTSSSAETRLRLFVGAVTISLLCSIVSLGLSISGVWDEHLQGWNQNLARCCILSLMPLEGLVWQLRKWLHGRSCASRNDSDTTGDEYACHICLVKRPHTSSA